MTALSFPRLVIIGLALSGLAACLAWSFLSLWRHLDGELDRLATNMERSELHRSADTLALSLRVDEGFSRIESLASGAREERRYSMLEVRRGLQDAITALGRRLESLASSLEPRAAQAAVPVALLPARGYEGAEFGAAENDLVAMQELSAGRGHFAAGEYALARERFAAALRLQNGNTQARLYSALSLYLRNPGDQSAYPTVERDLRLVLESEPGQKEALDTLGLMAMERGRWSEAESCFARIIALGPPSTVGGPARKKAAVCALRGGRPAEALAYIDPLLGDPTADKEVMALRSEALAAIAK